MNDHDIKTMLQNLQRDLRHSPNTLTWQTREFIPEEVREKRVKHCKILILTLFPVISCAIGLGLWLKIGEQQATLFYILMTIVLLICVSQAAYVYLKLIPRIRENEYALQGYQIDLKKQKLTILNGDTVQAEHRFQAAPILPALPLPNTETAYYQTIQQAIQTQISKYTGLKFQ